MSQGSLDSPEFAADQCLNCEAAIPEGTLVCPGCGTDHVICASLDCCRLYPEEFRFCPYCQSANGTPVPGDPADAYSLAPGDEDQAVEAEPLGLETLLAPDGPGMADAILDHRTLIDPAPAPTSSLTCRPAAPAQVPTEVERMQEMASAAPMWATGLAGLLPLVLEVEVGEPPKRGQQCLLRLRVSGLGLTDDAVAILTAQSALWTDVVRYRLDVGVAQMLEFPAIRFVPRLSGSDEVRLSLEVTDSESQPLGRWLGSHVLSVAENPQRNSDAIRATGDVYIIGGNPQNGLPGSLGDFAAGARLSSWLPVELRADSAYARRLAKSCPSDSRLAPLAPLGSATPFAGQLGLVHISGAGRSDHTIAVVLGSYADLGRGGDPAVAWWLQPAPYDVKQHTRLSRRHLRVELRGSRAWLLDCSTNGSWLNGERLEKDMPALIADGDTIDPAQVAPLAVRLVARDDNVHGVWLCRRDALAERLSYLLCDGVQPVRIDLGRTGMWFFWRRQEQRALELSVCTDAALGWQAVPRDSTLQLPDTTVAWETLAEPGEQAAYLKTED